jgi:hypothetical protein
MPIVSKRPWLTGATMVFANAMLVTGFAVWEQQDAAGPVAIWGIFVGCVSLIFAWLVGTHERLWRWALISAGALGIIGFGVSVPAIINGFVAIGDGELSHPDIVVFMVAMGTISLCYFTFVFSVLWSSRRRRPRSSDAPSPRRDIGYSVSGH